MFVDRKNSSVTTVICYKCKLNTRQVLRILETSHRCENGGKTIVRFGFEKFCKSILWIMSSRWQSFNSKHLLESVNDDDNEHKLDSWLYAKHFSIQKIWLLWYAMINNFQTIHKIVQGIDSSINIIYRKNLNQQSYHH